MTPDLDRWRQATLEVKGHGVCIYLFFIDLAALCLSGACGI